MRFEQSSACLGLKRREAKPSRWRIAPEHEAHHGAAQGALPVEEDHRMNGWQVIGRGCHGGDVVTPGPSAAAPTARMVAQIRSIQARSGIAYGRNFSRAPASSLKKSAR